VKKKILIVVADYYETIARSLLNSAKNKIKNKCSIKVINVPGAFEIPVTIAKNLNKFNGFKIKIVISGTDEAHAPKFQDIRAIALA